MILSLHIISVVYPIFRLNRVITRGAAYHLISLNYSILEIRSAVGLLTSNYRHIQDSTNKCDGREICMKGRVKKN